MPPLLEDEDSSGEDSSGEDIPFKAAKDDASDNDEVDEYVIEDIIGHEWDEPSGEYLYHVKWEGYDDPDDTTWEPEANLESALSALKAYFRKIGGRPDSKQTTSKKAGAGKKRKATNTPKSASSRVKRIKSETPELSTKKRTAGAAASSKADDWRLPQGSWEDQVANIDTIEEALDDKGVMQRYVYIMWENGNKTRHQLATVNQKCPQKMLRYYENHLVFRTVDPAAYGDL